VVAVSTLLRWLASERRDRDKVHLVRNVDVPTPAKPADTTPAGVDVSEWKAWSEGARYVFLERLGVGDELRMDPEEALRIALVEARMEQARVPVSSRALMGQAMLLFGARIVSHKPRSKR
jgi:hypothetical protein